MKEVIAVSEYTATLKGKDGMSPAKPDTQRKATKAINDFKEYLSKRDKTIPDESDIEAYRIECEATDGSKDKSATVQKIKYIRGYYALNDERSKGQPMTDENMKEAETISAGVDDSASTEKTAMNEPESWPKADPVKAKKNRKNEEKKVPVSVYLDAETHRVMKAISIKEHKSIGDIVSEIVKEFAEMNEETADEIEKALQAVESIKVRRVKYD